jgi:hypothetical protein
MESSTTTTIFTNHRVLRLSSWHHRRNRHSLSIFPRRQNSTVVVVVVAMLVLWIHPTTSLKGIQTHTNTFQALHQTSSSLNMPFHRNDNDKTTRFDLDDPRRLRFVIYPPPSKQQPETPNTSSSPSPGVILPTSIPSMMTIASNHPSGAPSISFSPTLSPYVTTTSKNRTSNLVTYTTSCRNTTRTNASSSSVIPVVISFDYTMTLIPDSNRIHEALIPTVENILHTQLSQYLMEDCDFHKNASHPREKAFEVMDLHSAPIDTIDNANETCGDDCRIIHGHVTAGIFYLNRRRDLHHRILQQRDTTNNNTIITDPVIAATFGREIVRLFNQTNLFDSNIASLVFRGITNNAVYDTFGTRGDDDDDDNDNDANATSNVAAIATQSWQSQQQKRNMGWGSAVVAFAGMAFVTLTVVAVLHRKRRQISTDFNHADHGKEFGNDDWDAFHETHDENQVNQVTATNHHDEKETQLHDHEDASEYNPIAYIVHEDVAKLHDAEDDDEYGGVEIQHHANVSGSLFQWKTNPPTFIPTDLDSTF